MQPRRAFAVGVLHVVAGVLPGFLTAALAPRIDADLSFSASEVGLAVALFYVVCAGLSSPAGHLVERIGGRRALLLGAASTVVCCLSVAGLAQSAASLIALLLAGGIGNALAVPAASAVISRNVPAARRGVAFGSMQAGAPLGALVAGLALPAVAIPLGWRWAFVATAGLAMLVALAAPAAPLAAPRAGHAGGARRHGLTEVHALAATAMLASMAGTGLVSFIVLYAVDSGLGEAEAGLLLAGLSLAAAASRIALGLAVDRSGGDPLAPVGAMLLASVAGFALLVAGEPAAVVAGALLAGGVGWAWPGALTSAVVARSPDAPAWAVGVMMSGLFGGAVAGPLAVGLLAERERFTEAWAALAVFAALAAATVFVLRSRPAP